MRLWAGILVLVSGCSPSLIRLGWGKRPPLPPDTPGDVLGSSEPWFYWVISAVVTSGVSVFLSHKYRRRDQNRARKAGRNPYENR